MLLIFVDDSFIMLLRACNDSNFHVYLFCTYIRPIVESNSIIWNPSTLADIDRVEDVQRRFSKFLPGLYNVSYQDRLSILNIDSLEVRRLNADLVFLYKMIHNLVDLEFGNFFSLII